MGHYVVFGNESCPRAMASAPFIYTFPKIILLFALLWGVASSLRLQASNPLKTP